MNRKRAVAIALLVLIIGGGLIAAAAGLFNNDPDAVNLSMQLLLTRS